MTKTKIINNFVPVLILFLVSLAVIFPYIQQGLIIGVGEAAFLIDPGYLELFYTWNEKIGVGVYNGAQANIMLYSVFWSLLEKLEFIAHPSIIFTFLAFFLPGLFMFLFLRKFFEEKYYLFLALPAFLYSFNMFRISISYTNTNQNLLFIFLPLLFWAFYNLITKRDLVYSFVLVILSVLASSVSGNLSVGLIPYVLMLLFFVYYLYVNNFKHVKKIIGLCLLTSVLVILVNLFWIVPLATFLFTQYKLVGGGLWDAVSAGQFFDHFRFMGFWAFRSGYSGEAYFPYYLNYYKPFFVISTFAVVLFSFLHYLFKLPKLSKELVLIRGFAIFVALFSFLLVAGAKGPLGFMYEFFFENVPMLKIFREPYAKFMPLFIFATCINFAISFKLVIDFAKNKIVAPLLFIVFFALILINVFPLFTGEALYFRRWIEGSAGSVTKIPDYWEEAEEYIETQITDERIALSPQNSYVSKYNWPYGVNVVGNIADYIVDKTFVKSWHPDKSNAGKIMALAFSDESFDQQVFTKLLGLFSVKYIVQQNDLEWRYSDRINSPVEITTNFAFQPLNLEKTFGMFDDDALRKIQNLESNPKIKLEFYTELNNKPAVQIYKSTDNNYLPLIYAPEATVLVNDSISRYIQLFSLQNWPKNSQFVFESDSFINKDQQIDAIVLFGDKNDSPPIDINSRRWHSNWAWPNSKVNPKHKIYNLSLLKERMGLLKSKDPFYLIERYTWYGAKRISELQNYNLNEEITNKIVKSYLEYNKDAIALIQNKKDSLKEETSYWEANQKFYTYLERGLSYLINNPNVDTELILELNKIYTQYVLWLSTQDELLQREDEYSFNISKLGSYNLYVYNQAEWQELDEFNFTQPTEITINPKDYNLETEQTVFEIDTLPQNQIEYLFPISDWDSNYSYDLYIEHNTNKKQIEIELFENSDHIESVFDKELSHTIPCFSESKCFTTYKVTLEPQENFNNAILKVRLPNKALENQQNYINKVKLVKNFDLKFALVSNELNQLNQDQPPTLEFTKVNPTKYYINVSNAQNPYTFAFNASFNKDWKLYKAQKSSKISKNAQSYINKDTFETVGKNPIAQNAHFETNGYANAWYIEPQDVEFEQDYTLILEFAPQRQLYLAFIVSGVVFVLSLLIASALFVNKKYGKKS